MFLYALLVASLLALSIMIGLRIRNIRLGKAYEQRPENYHIPEINLTAARNSAVFYGKQFGHLFVLLLLRVWIKSTYFIKRKAKEFGPKIERLLTPKHRRHDPNRQTPVSNFLNSISEYKKKIKRAHDHMKREEEERDSTPSTL